MQSWVHESLGKVYIGTFSSNCSSFSHSSASSLWVVGPISTSIQLYARVVRSSSNGAGQDSAAGVLFSIAVRLEKTVLQLRVEGTVTISRWADLEDTLAVITQWLLGSTRSSEYQRFGCYYDVCIKLLLLNLAGCPNLLLKESLLSVKFIPQFPFL